MKVEVTLKLDKDTIDHAVERFVKELIMQQAKKDQLAFKRSQAAKKAWKAKRAREQKRRLEEIKKS